MINNKNIIIMIGLLALIYMYVYEPENSSTEGFGKEKKKDFLSKIKKLIVL